MKEEEMGDTSSAADFLQTVHNRRAEALEEVAQAHAALIAARRRYEEALLTAHDRGVTNTAIARVTNKTETAVRMFLKRRKRA